MNAGKKADDNQLKGPLEEARMKRYLIKIFEKMQESNTLINNNSGANTLINL